MGIPKTSVFMMMSTLERMGYVEKVDDSRYRVTMKLYNIGIENTGQIRYSHGCASFYGGIGAAIKIYRTSGNFKQRKAVYIEKVNGPTFVQFDTRIGQSMFIHSSAVGKALAAYLDEEAVDEILENHPMVRATENTITTPKMFKKFLASVRETGYAIEDEEEEVGVRCLGAPIFNDKVK